MITLGLDPSLTGFGWCVIDSRKAPGEGRVVAKGVVKTLASTVFVLRYVSLRDTLIELLKEHSSVENVGVESPPFGEQFSEGLYGLFLYVNEALALQRKDVVYFDPLTVKALAKMDSSVRKGTMDKRDMIEAARVDSGLTPWNHNEADAYIIARSASRFWEYMGGYLEESELTPSERGSFLRIHTVKRGPLAGQTVKKGLVFRESDRFFRFSSLGVDGT